MGHDPLVIILAAGLGTRMKSDTAKVLHTVARRPLVSWPVELARGIGARRTVVVLGHQFDAVKQMLETRYPGALSFARQEQQRGTGDAVRCALAALEAEPDDAPVVILSGDVPLLTRETIDGLLAARGANSVALVAMRPVSPAGYGRLVRDARGRLQKIVEDKDATGDEKKLGETNAGIYAIAHGFLRAGIAELSPTNAQGELYLTDIVARAARLGQEIPVVEASADEVEGVNDRVQLARLDGIARRRIAERWMRAGVTIEAPDSVFIDPDIQEIGRDTLLGAGVQLRGASTRIGARVQIDVGCLVSDATIGDETHVKPYSMVNEARVGARVQIGPFAHCRPGTVLEDDVRIGNFVETKKTRLGPGAKANHLSYLGDADIGAKVNVGAGTITCNYDGVNKFKTVIEDGAFIGSDTQLIAPVTVGKGAYVGAGTTVTKDVPAGALAISRTQQVNKEGYVDKKKGKK